VKRILLITPFAPSRAAQHGSGRAVSGLARALAHRHELVVLHLEAQDAVDPELLSHCEARALPPPSRGRWRARAIGAGGLLRGRSLWASELGVCRLQRTVASLSAEFKPHVVQVEHGIVGEALAGAGKRPIRIVTMYETAASLREFLPLRREGLGLAHRLDAVAAVRQERRILSLADAAVVFSDRDRHRLANHTNNSAAIVTIPMGWEVSPTPLDPSGASPPVLLFVGNFVHPPNIDAAIRLAREVLPRVRNARPDVTAEIVGSSPPPEVRALADETVSVTGAVPSVIPHLDRAAVVVAPIKTGSGVRVKILEALAAGKAIVTTPRAVEGLSARPRHELLVAESAEDLAAATLQLLNDPEARIGLARRAREWAERELTWAGMADRYDVLYDKLALLKREHAR
jgi:polysaccharide biosynthesis protein PslH